MFLWRLKGESGGVAGFLERWARTSPFIASFILAALFFGGVWNLSTPYFQENDDVFKLFFVKGVGTCTAPSEFLGHSNVLAGFLLSRLYAWRTHVPWYALYLALPLFGGIWAMTAAYLIAAKNLAVRLSLFVLFCVGVLSYFLFVYEFAITPQIATQGAFLLMVALAECEGNAWRLRGLLLAALLVAVSCIIRLDGMALAVLVAIPWLALVAWRNRRHPWRWGFVTYLLCLGVFVAGVTMFSRAYYDAEPGWRSFEGFNHQIEQLKDYRNTVFDARTKGIFESLGWSANDVEMFHDYCYVDRRLHTVENYRTLIPHFSHWTNQGKLGTISSLAQMRLDPLAMMTLVFILVSCLFMTRGKRLWQVLSLLWVVAILLFLIYYLRCPQRLYLPCLVFVALIGIFEADRTVGEAREAVPLRIGDKLRWGALAFLFVLAPVNLSMEHRWNTKQRVVETSFRNCVKSLGPRRDQLFVVWGSCLLYEGIRAYDDFEMYRDFNIYPLAVFQRAPQCLAMLERFGIRENLFREMVGRKDIFLICRPEDVYMYGTYMMEKFGVKIRAVWTLETTCFNVYRIEDELASPRAGR